MIESCNHSTSSLCTTCARKNIAEERDTAMVNRIDQLEARNAELEAVNDKVMGWDVEQSLRTEAKITELTKALEDIKKHMEICNQNFYRLSAVWRIASKALED